MANTHVPYVRRNLIGAPAPTDAAADPLTGPLPPRIAVTVQATVSPPASPATPIDVPIQGPGEITTIDPPQRKYPAADATEVETNFFAMAEWHSEPDLAWQYTPARPNNQRLRSYVALVVVTESGSELVEGPDSVGVLRVGKPATELPDLPQSHAWQFTAVPGQSAARLATRDTAAAAAVMQTGVVRLVCPRRLEPGIRYIAAVVPTLEHARLNGLRMPIAEGTLNGPAWTFEGNDVILPVYHYWRFTAGPGGDFEALASRLSRHRSEPVAAIPAQFGAQAGLPALDTVQLAGILGGEPDDPIDAAFRALLAGIVESDTPPAGMPLPPPWYGRWHAAAAAVNDVPWANSLNTLLSARYATGIGTDLERIYQSQMLARSWRQVEGIEAANALRARAQFARHATIQQHRDLAGLPPIELLQLTAPMHARIVDPGSGRTVAATVAGSRVPVAMLSPEFRRAMRPGGRLGRHQHGRASNLLHLVNIGWARVVPERPVVPDGMVTVDDTRTDNHIPGWCIQRPPSAFDDPDGDRRPPAVHEEDWWDLLKLLAALEEIKAPCEAPEDRRPPLNVDRLAKNVVAATDPRTTLPARTNALARLPGWNPADPLDPIMVCPRDDTPVAELVIAQHPDFLLPGVSELPTNSVTAVRSNPRQIEACMVGINHAMMRELTFHGFPTDLRGTVFHRFWNRAGSVQGARDDIDPIHTWKGALGEHLLASEDQVVLVIRGDVLARYPGTSIYAAKARWDPDHKPRPALVGEPAPAGSKPGDAGHPHLYPSFRGTIGADITYLGFEFPEDPVGDPDDPQASPGWFLVLAEPPFDSRYGLDEDRPANPAPGSDNLSWQAVGQRAGYIDLSVVGDPDLPTGWGPGATSAQLASWCSQRPFALGIHASLLLPRDTP